MSFSVLRIILTPTEIYGKGGRRKSSKSQKEVIEKSNYFANLEHYLFFKKYAFNSTANLVLLTPEIRERYN